MALSPVWVVSGAGRGLRDPLDRHQARVPLRRHARDRACGGIELLRADRVAHLATLAPGLDEACTAKDDKAPLALAMRE
jgi:hypothetical protein